MKLARGFLTIFSVINFEIRYQVTFIITQSKSRWNNKKFVLQN